MPSDFSCDLVQVARYETLYVHSAAHPAIICCNVVYVTRVSTSSVPRRRSTFSDPQKGCGQSFLRHYGTNRPLKGLFVPLRVFGMQSHGSKMHWAFNRQSLAAHPTFQTESPPKNTRQKRHRLERNQQMATKPLLIETRSTVF